MGFLRGKQAVACALLMALVANAQNQPDNNCCCSLESLETRLASIESRLYDLQRDIPLINYPTISQNCTAYLAANGIDDSKRIGYATTRSGDISGSEPMNLPRGVSLFELDATKCLLENKQSFDTYTSADDIAQLLETLESATVGKIVVGVTSDTAELGDNLSFQRSVGSFFTRYNMNITGLQFRDKFAFVLQKGYPKKTVFQRKARYGESLKMQIQLSGSYVSSVTFNRL